MNQRDPYQVLGITPNATDDEVREAYRALVRKYHPDRYGPDNPLADLAKEKMQEINAAYEEIRLTRSRASSGGGGSRGGSTGYTGSATGIYAEIRRDLNAHRFGAAEAKLEAVPAHDRTAEWHYLKSVTLMRRGWANDAMRELETACMMDPDNAEYQNAKEMFNRTARGYGSTYYNEGQRSSQGCCISPDCCTAYCCMNLLCDLCGAGC